MKKVIALATAAAISAYASGASAQGEALPGVLGGGTLTTTATIVTVTVITGAALLTDGDGSTTTTTMSYP